MGMTQTADLAAMTSDVLLHPHSSLKLLILTFAVFNTPIM